MIEQWDRKRTVAHARWVVDVKHSPNSRTEEARFARGVLRMETEMRKLEGEVAALRARVGRTSAATN